MAAGGAGGVANALSTSSSVQDVSKASLTGRAGHATCDGAVGGDHVSCKKGLVGWKEGKGLEGPDKGCSEPGEEEIKGLRLRGVDGC